ncbi:Olfactory Receptor 5A1 [Manis pentadactyla]|nr:Olfactory Receptor 5A1 [Manis pentadactyla]
MPVQVAHSKPLGRWRGNAGILQRTGNICVITVMNKDSHLHMCVFLPEESVLLDVCYASVTVPKAISHHQHHYGFGGCLLPKCAAQLHLFFTLEATECFLLTAMAYDHCMAIHRPPFYGVTMSRNICRELVSTVWIWGALYSIPHASNTFSLPFCGPNILDHFFCDIPPIMRLCCKDYCDSEGLSFTDSSASSWELLFSL